jgi:hypothetical protein
MRSTGLACGAITPGEAATIAVVYETFVRTAGIAKEKVARGNLPRILTAGDDVEDDDERRIVSPAAVGRRQLRVAIVEGPLFNLEEKFSCRFSADAGRGNAPCNSWLIGRRAARGSPTARRQSANRRRRYTGTAQRCVLRHARRPAGAWMLPWPTAMRRANRPLAGRLAPQMNYRSLSFIRAILARPSHASPNSPA